MAKSACKCKESECEECPEWIFTFADLVMLMMGFFVILWVLKPNTNPEKKEEGAILPIELLAKIREAFDYLPDPQSKDPVDVYMILKKLESLPPLKSPGNGGETQKTRQGAVGTDPEVITIRQGKAAIVGTRLMFASGSADMSPATTTELVDIAKVITGHRNIVLVKGHTSIDDFPENADAQTRMNLSVRRAQVVSDFLVSHGVSPDMLRVQGCSVFEPVKQRAYTADARSQNRRVEIEATDTLVPERQDAVKATSPEEASSHGSESSRTAAPSHTTTSPHTGHAE